MNVALFQLDGKLPNLALMRVAAHHKHLGDSVTLHRACDVDSLFQIDADRVYASLIFESTKPVGERLKHIRPDALIGGTGWNVFTTLEDHNIPDVAPDYSFWPKFTASIGFTQRGCRLRCPFCVVPRKEGPIRSTKNIADIYRGDPYPRHLHLLDNDFFGSPGWQARTREIIDGGFRVCFSQGINARMIDDTAAATIGAMQYYDDSFTTRRIYTAWDNRKDEDRLFAGLNALVRHGVKPDHIMVYMLVGYWPGETWQDREYRRAKLRDFGARPYPMPFVRTPELVGFQRFVIRAIDKNYTWQQFERARFRPENLKPFSIFPMEPRWELAL